MRFKNRNILLFIVLFFSLIVLYLVNNRYKDFYSYRPNIDYNYHSKNLAKAEISDSKIILPIFLDSSYSVFAKVRVKSGLFSNFLSPRVEISSNSKMFDQYFEYNTNGFRYINLSSFISTGVRQLEIIPYNCKIENQIVDLMYFKKTNFCKSKILIISPHPDDAELASFGLYNNFNNNTTIITITAGEIGPFNYEDLPQLENLALAKGKMRTWNSITIPLLGGINYNRIVNLGFFDRTLELMFNNKNTEFGSLSIENADIHTFRVLNISSLKDSLVGSSNWYSLVDNIKYLVSIIDPDIIVTPYPALESHPDHVYSTMALFEALKELENRKGNLYLYVNHLRGNERYPYGRAGSIVTLPPNFDDSIYYESIESLFLDNESQTNKYLALDAMNDLRIKSTVSLVSKSVKNIMKDYFPIESFDYSRRFVRSNELFFVVPVEKIYSDTNLEYLLHGKKDLLFTK